MTFPNSLKLVNPPVVMPSSLLQRLMCRLGYHDYSGGILPGLFEMRFEGVPGSWWPISSSILWGGYCIYCGECLPGVIIIPCRNNPEELQIAGSLEDVLTKISEVQKCQK